MAHRGVRLADRLPGAGRGGAGGHAPALPLRGARLARGDGDARPTATPLVAGAPAPVITRTPAGTALRTVAFWQLGGSFFTCGFSMALVAAHGVPMLTDHGYTPIFASWVIGVLGASSIVFTLTLGRLSDTFGRAAGAGRHLRGARVHLRRALPHPGQSGRDHRGGHRGRHHPGRLHVHDLGAHRRHLRPLLGGLHPGRDLPRAPDRRRARLLAGRRPLRRDGRLRRHVRHRLPSCWPPPASSACTWTGSRACSAGPPSPARTKEISHGRRAHGDREDPGGEGQGRRAGRAAQGAGGRRDEGGAGPADLPPASLQQGPRPLHLLRAVQGRRRLRAAPQGAVPGRLPRAPREARA